MDNGRVSAPAKLPFKRPCGRGDAKELRARGLGQRPWQLGGSRGLHAARFETHLALGEFLRRIPEFRLDSGGVVMWSTGQIRGPRKVPIVYDPAGTMA